MPAGDRQVAERQPRVERAGFRAVRQLLLRAVPRASRASSSRRRAERAMSTTPSPRFTAQLPSGHSSRLAPVARPARRRPRVSRKSVSRARSTSWYCTSQVAHRRHALLADRRHAVVEARGAAVELARGVGDLEPIGQPQHRAAQVREAPVVHAAIGLVNVPFSSRPPLKRWNVPWKSPWPEAVKRSRWKKMSFCVGKSMCDLMR